MAFGHHKHEYVEAIYQFDPQNEGDLQIKPGDKIEVTEKCSADWYKGKCNGKEGMFPANYVKPAFSGESGARPAAPPPQQSEKDKQPEQPQQQAQPMVVQQDKPHRHRCRKGLSKFGRKLGNATIFGAGATIGNNIVNAIL
ncbi:(ZYRO0G20372g) [Zygosaccharomyces parabailii]|uniref:SH3 domain-containing protein n=1 Tax=Zygosaccharomyces bailii (strain CLIB 213 / ATCC 58445 / CBS 680 / BCRC 21525 / NBRC 1098 / NCYC 1416 / NRRL Y-2227) TaxID=1333698 RepID=A0A8J2X7B3_ZYGB2|nr:(ZYRO0G20372g) [Zygosaccharomyces parabailii]CDF88977.1 unnamed protein product [Zygosaccharomyces bailii CLIB 213]CDH10206.1 related to [PSI+] inducibility protein 3 [Zygosaccharomyces bailii ISA1307]SJM83107.1 related to [PSI+] inducibility protein 3 [Zygosaccharomyces bailii]AQZ17772.1 (ZYRO0G20372g) [Zygosaccharomyces parabailii]